MQSLVGNRPLRVLSGMAPRGSASPALATLARLIAPTAFPAPLVRSSLYGVALGRRCFSRLRHHPLRIPPASPKKGMLEICLSVLCRSMFCSCSALESASSPPTCGTVYVLRACGDGIGRMTEAQVARVQRVTAVGAKRLKRWHPAAAARVTGARPQQDSTLGPAQAALL